MPKIQEKTLQSADNERTVAEKEPKNSLKRSKSISWRLTSVAVNFGRLQLREADLGSVTSVRSSKVVEREAVESSSVVKA